MSFTEGPWRTRSKNKAQKFPGSGVTELVRTPNGSMTISAQRIPKKGEMAANARLIAEAPELYAELDLIVEAWEEIDVGKVPGRKLTPWEKERLNFARDTLDKVDGG